VTAESRTADAPEYAEDEPFDDSQIELKTQNSKLKTSLSYLTLLSRLVLGGIFLLAGLTKLGDVKGMTESIDSYRMVPIWLSDFMAVTLPPLEIALGIFLLLGLFTRIAAGITGGLVLMFLIALTQAMVRGFGNEIACGCFATGPGANALGDAVMKSLGPVGKFLSNEKADAQTIVRDLLFLLMAVHLVFIPTVFGLDALRRKGRESGGGDQEYAYEET
jgi:uncharacterized membrane protein YphA (DoxX/SURF4 family)